MNLHTLLNTPPAQALTPLQPHSSSEVKWRTLSAPHTKDNGNGRDLIVPHNWQCAQRFN